MNAQDHITLTAREVTVEFDGLTALADVDLSLERGEILGLIGPNGAGKTTMVNVLSGFQRPTAGQVVIEGEPMTGARPDRVARKGVARTFQSVRVFPALTVRENVEAAAVASGSNRRNARTVCDSLLDRMGLWSQATKSADALPHGDERRLGIARALATRPRFLLLDEPAAGLNEAESDELVTRIRAIRDDFECGVLLIEHDVRLMMDVSERIQVLDYGKTISVGTPQEVRHDPRVIAAYLGSPEVTS
jgi:branched-chain amino acid transport system ATP-binding protein